MKYLYFSQICVCPIHFSDIANILSALTAYAIWNSCDSIGSCTFMPDYLSDIVFTYVKIVFIGKWVSNVNLHIFGQFLQLFCILEDMVKSKHEFLLWFKFDFKMIHTLTFLCLTTFIVNPAGEVINSKEFEQFGSDKGLFFFCNVLKCSWINCNHIIKIQKNRIRSYLSYMILRIKNYIFRYPFD